MPNVYMDEPVRVQSVGAGGIGFDPPVPVEDVEKISETGREMYGVQGKANVLPNPANTVDGKVIQTADGSFSVEAASPMEKIYNSELFIGTPVVTKLEADGYTRIENAIVFNKSSVQFGCFYESGKFNLRASSSYYDSDPSSIKCLILYGKDSTDDPYEFTIENAPKIQWYDFPAASKGQAYSSTRITASNTLDVRLGVAHFDDHGNMDDLFLSAQYRYTQSGGVVTRTKVATSPQDPSCVIDVGAYKCSDVDMTQGFFRQTAPDDLIMLISRGQTEKYRMMLPPSAFEDATYGLSIAVVRGDGSIYTTQSFFKPTPGLPTPPTGDGTYTMQVVVTDGVPTFYWVQIVHS